MTNMHEEATISPMKIERKGVDHKRLFRW